MGVGCLIYNVPVELGAAHQLGSVFLESAQNLDFANCKNEKNVALELSGPSIVRISKLLEKTVNIINSKVSLHHFFNYPPIPLKPKIHDLLTC